MSDKPKLVKRILAKGKRFNVIQEDGTRKRVEGPCTVEVTEAQATAFKSHWRTKEVEVDVPDVADVAKAGGKDPKVAAAEAAVAKAKAESDAKPEDVGLKQTLAKAKAALKALQG